MKNLLLIIGLGIGLNVNAQSNDTEILHGNNVSALIGDNGFFFNNTTASAAGYSYPNLDSAKTIFSSSIWVGALDQYGQPAVTYNTFVNSGTKWGSGPIANNYTSLDYSEAYSKSNWKITREEVENHINSLGSSGYTTPESILEWPGNPIENHGIAQELAPFVDINGNGIYEPNSGDYPDFPGREAIFVLLNNQSTTHNSSPFKVELHLLFYQFHTGNYLSNTTFVNTKVFNRGNANYTDFRQSIFIDYDLGLYSDDLVGCSPEHNINYVYNGANNDPGSFGVNGFGENCPSQGMISLNQNMSSFCYFYSNAPLSQFEGFDTQQNWNLMNSIWADGTPFTYDGTGYGGNTETNYLFPGHPSDTNGWSEITENNPSGDRRVLQTHSANSFSPGTMICTDYAFIYDRSGDHIQNVQGVLNIGQALQYLYDASGMFPCQISSLNIEETNSIDFNLFPNPTNGEAHIFLPENISKGTLQIIAMDGKTILTKEIESNTVSFSIEKSGIYFVKIESEGIVGVKKLVVE